MRVHLERAKCAATFLLIVILGSLASSIAQAQWTNGLDTLLPVSVVGVLAGAVLSGMRIRPFRAQLLGLVAGFLYVLWQTASTIPEWELYGRSRIGVAWSRLLDWLSTVLGGGVGEDQLLFVFTMAAITWLLAFESAWFVLKHRWIWWAILPVGLVLLVNIGYSPHPNNIPFVIFLIASMLMVIQFHFLRNRDTWVEEGLGQEPGIGSRTLLIGSVISVLLLTIAWQGPSRDLRKQVHTVVSELQKPWTGLEDRWAKAFAFLNPASSIPGLGAMGGGFTTFTDSFSMGGPLKLGKATVFKATGDPAQYWQGVTYDTYTGRGWKSSTVDPNSNSGKIIETEALDPTADQKQYPDNVYPIQQQVTMVRPVGRFLFGSSRQVATNRDVLWRVAVIRKSGTLPVWGNPKTALPERYAKDLRKARQLIRSIGTRKIIKASPEGVTLVPRKHRIAPTPVVGTGRSSPRPDLTSAIKLAHERRLLLKADQLRSTLERLSLEGLRASFERKGKTSSGIKYSYSETNRYDVASVTSVAPMARGSSYKMTSIISNPSDKQLNADNEPAPSWLREKYLQVPNSVPDRVRKLALQVTVGAKTKHEKAQRIESFLRQFKYKADMPVTPANRDFVDYFLFDQKQGYCTYYASAMVVMLRSVGVPARLVTGFAPGKYNSSTGQYTVTEAQAHAWPQVYYSKYGWVNYDPTPIRAPVARANANVKPASGSQDSGRPIQSPFDKTLCTGAGAPSQFCQGVGQGQAFGAAGTERSAPKPLLGALGVIASLILIALAVLLVSLLQIRGLKGTKRHYAKLMQVGAALGIRLRTSQTPAEYGDTLGTVLPGVQPSIRRITTQYSAEVFGRRSSEDSGLARAWNSVAAQAIRRLPSRTLHRLFASRPVTRLRTRFER